MTRILTTSPTKLIDVACRWYLVHVQVKTAGTVYLAYTQNELENPDTTGAAQGLSIVAGDGIKSFFWTGELWANSSQNVAVDFQVIVPTWPLGGLQEQ